MAVYLVARKTDGNSPLFVRKAVTQHGADSKRPVSFAIKVHWTPPFCIALCSVDLFGLVVEAGFVPGFDNGGEVTRHSDTP